MPFLRQSTIQTIRFGPFLDATDGVTEETGLTITRALRRISKDGGAFAQSNHTGNSTHDSDGWYQDNLDATDTNTVGELILNVQVPATHLPVWMRWWVLEEAVYDAIYGAAATLNTNVGSGGITTASFAAGAINAAAIAANAIGSSELAANAIGATQIASDAITAAKIATDAITAAKIAANALDGKGDWNIGKTGYSLTVAPLTAAQVNTQVDLALSDIHLDHLFATDYDPAAKPGVGTALLNEMVENDAGVSRFTVNALEQAPTGGSAPTVAQIADGVWDELMVGHAIADSAGEVLNDWQNGGRLDVLLDAIPTTAMRGTDSAALASVATEARLAELDAANLPLAVDAILVDTGTTLNNLVDDLETRIPDVISLANIRTQADDALVAVHLDHLLAVDYDPAAQPGVATALFNELIESDAGISRYTVNALEQAPTGGSAPTVAAIADGVWDELLAGHVIADSAGELLNDWQEGGRLDLLLDGIKVPTDKLVFTVTNQVDANVQSINDVTIIGDGSATPFNV